MKSISTTRVGTGFWASIAARMKSFLASVFKFDSRSILLLGLALSLIGLVGWSDSVLAQPANPQALYAASLAASCASCHGTMGHASPLSAVPGLAGIDKAGFIAQMKAYQTGAKTATVMHQISKGFSDPQIETLAVYFSTQKK